LHETIFILFVNDQTHTLTVLFRGQRELPVIAKINDIESARTVS